MDFGTFKNAISRINHLTREFSCTMKCRATLSLLARKKMRNAITSKFNKMVRYEKDVEKVHLDDPRIEWSTNQTYNNVEVCKIAGVNVPEGEFSITNLFCSYTQIHFTWYVILLVGKEEETRSI